MNRIDGDTVIGLFDRREDAVAALAELRGWEFTDDDLGLVTPDAGHAPALSDLTRHAETVSPVEGATAGAMAGGAAAGVLGLAAVAGVIPGVGLAVAAGLTASIAASVAGGAAAGGLAGALVGIGVPKQQADAVHAHHQAGRTILLVRAGTRGDRAAEALRRHGAAEVTHPRAE